MGSKKLPSSTRGRRKGIRQRETRRSIPIPRPPKKAKPTKPDPPLLIGVRREYFPNYIHYLHEVAAGDLADNYQELTNGDCAVRLEIFEQDELYDQDLEGVLRVVLVYDRKEEI